MTEQQHITTADLRKYRTELPNLYDDAGLSVYEFRLLAHYVRVGTTWESVRTTAEKCKMSHPMVIKTRKSLEDKGFIIVCEEAIPTGKAIIITIVDKWADNYAKYSGHTVEQVVTRLNEGGHTVESGGHTVELKKEPIKKEPIKNTPGQAYFLEALGAKKFRTNIQSVTIARLEKEYGLKELKGLIDWAAKQGMSLGRAVIAIEGALKKKPKTTGEKNIDGSLYV